MRVRDVNHLSVLCSRSEYIATRQAGRRTGCALLGIGVAVGLVARVSRRACSALCLRPTANMEVARRCARDLRVARRCGYACHARCQGIAVGGAWLWVGRSGLRSGGGARISPSASVGAHVARRLGRSGLG
jgi:hypothetical protein